MSATSSPAGTCSGSIGSGAARRFASCGPRRATFIASCSSSMPCPRTLERPICAQRSTTVRAVHGSGRIPVSTNSTGRLSACCSMKAFTPSAYAVKICSASGW
jgi:hypothetical protein